MTSFPVKCKHITLSFPYKVKVKGQRSKVGFGPEPLPTLLLSTVICEHCSGECSWIDKAGLDGWIWRRRRRGCQKRRSIRIGTLFEYSKLPLGTILQLVYWWCRGLSIQQTMIEVGVSKVTVVEWFQRCRAICADFLLEHQQPIGGPGKTVEIDETKIGHRKYNRGRLRDGVWVFGAIDADTNDVALSIVEDRSAATLIPLIQRLVRPGTTIMSDEWRAYDALGEHGYQHLTVNHSVQFVDPTTGANTQRIECVWAHAKQSIKKSRGVPHDHLQSYLVEFLWRRKYGRQNTFENFLEHISTLFFE